MGWAATLRVSIYRFCQKIAFGFHIRVYKLPRALYTKKKQSFIYFEESGVELEDYDMCESCSDAVAVDRARGYRVCRDCYYEMGV